MAELLFEPAEANAGITFIREQDGRRAPIPATVHHVLKRPRRTCLHNGTMSVETVEHVMAALSGMGINNITITVSGGATGEIPMGDGSASIFIEALEGAGILEQAVPVEPLVIRKAVHLTDGKASIAALPGPLDRLEVIYDFEAPLPYRGKDGEWLEFQNLSINGDKYPKGFNVKSQSGKEVWSGCSGIGLERWASTFFAQKGFDEKDWSDAFREQVGEMPKGIKFM